MCGLFISLCFCFAFLSTSYILGTSLFSKLTNKELVLLLCIVLQKSHGLLIGTVSERRICMTVQKVHRSTLMHKSKNPIAQPTLQEQNTEGISVLVWLSNHIKVVSNFAFRSLDILLLILCFLLKFPLFIHTWWWCFMKKTGFINETCVKSRPHDIQKLCNFRKLGLYPEHFWAFTMWGDSQTSGEFPTRQTFWRTGTQGTRSKLMGLSLHVSSYPTNAKFSQIIPFPFDNCRPAVSQVYNKSTVCKGMFTSSCFYTHIHNYKYNPQRKLIWYKCIFIFQKLFHFHKTAPFNFLDEKNTYTTSLSN